MNSDPLELLFEVFREEAREHIDTLSQLMLGLATEGVSVERLEQAMRTAHTLKGAAAMVGIEPIAARAHELEDRFLEWQADPSAFDLEIARTATDELHRQVDVLESRSKAASPHPLGVFVRSDATGPAVDAGPIAECVKSPVAKEASAGASEPGQAQRSGTVRIPAERLDEVRIHVEELVATRSELSVLMEQQRTLREQVRALLMREQLDRSAEGKALLRSMDSLEWPEHNTALHLERATGRLRESVRKLQLVPWGTLTAVLERTVRKTARALGKEVILQLVAPEIEVDKGVLAALQDPLIHVLRNAVDHGIESKPLRLAKGKPTAGLIRLSASFDNRGVTVLVEDDGSGIDIDALRGSAPRRVDGIELTSAAVLEQIFEPGRSTADHVSAISGRGVGLDLARRNLESSGGTISAIAQGELGGATFRLWVPVSMALGSALLVRAGDAFFSIGLEYVERILRLPATRVENVSGRLLLQQEGDEDPVPLVRLDELMGTGKAALGRELSVVMLVERNCRLPLLVDAVVDLRELLLLPLPWGLNGLPLLRGGSVLPDGSLVLALAPPEVLHLKSQGTRGSVGPAPISRGKRVLVVDDSHTARALAKSSLLSAGYEVELAVDGVDAWNRLEHGDFLVLVTDVQMPNMDGFELTRRVRADARLATLPVILVTTRSTREDIDRGLNLGADEYVVKGPLQREQLIEAVGRHA